MSAFLCGALLFQDWNSVIGGCQMFNVQMGGAHITSSLRDSTCCHESKLLRPPHTTTAAIDLTSNAGETWWQCVLQDSSTCRLLCTIMYRLEDHLNSNALCRMFFFDLVGVLHALLLV